MIRPLYVAGLVAVSVLIIIAVVIFFFVWIWTNNPLYMIDWWNGWIAKECDSQDQKNELSSHFQQLLYLNHQNILSETLEALTSLGHDSISSRSKNSGDIDIFPQVWIKDDSRWNPFWVRFMGEWSSSVNHLPTLKRIASLYPEVTNLYIAVFPPGASLIEENNPSRLTKRYHYGLKVNKGDAGIKTSSGIVRWENKDGFSWDDTRPYTAWNHTDQPQIIIVADTLREFSPLTSIGSSIMHQLLTHSRYVRETKYILKEGVKQSV